MVYYHVSSYVSEKQVLTHKSKNNRCFCEYVSNYSNDGYENYELYYNELLNYQPEKITGRDTSKWICEAVFDGIRKKCFPEKPSRIWGVFLSKDYDSAL